MAFTEGPYVQVACFCEQVIEDKTGVLSLIRIIDTVIHTQAGVTPPSEMPTFPYKSKLVLMFKSGRAQGRHELKLVPELPSGETESPATFTIHFEGEEKGQNIVIDFVFAFRFEGLYWFKVLIDEEQITALPVRVKYNRVVIPNLQPPVPPAS